MNGKTKTSQLYIICVVIVANLLVLSLPSYSQNNRIFITNENFEALVNRSDRLRLQAEYDASNHLLNQLLDYSKKVESVENQALILNKLGEHHLYFRNLDSAKHFAQEAIDLSVKHNLPVHHSNGLFIKGYIGYKDVNSTNLNDFGISIQLCEDGEKIAKTHHLKALEYKCRYCKMFSLMSYNNSKEYNFNIGLPEVRTSMEGLLIEKDTAGFLTTAMKMQDLYRGNGFLDSAIILLEKVENILEYYPDTYRKISVLNSKRANVFQQGKIEEAFKITDEAIALARKVDLKETVQHLFIQYSHMYKSKKDYETAKNLLDSAIAAYPTYLTGHIYMLTYWLYKEAGDKDNTLKYVEKYVDYIDADFQGQQAELVEEFKIKHETQQKEAELERQREQSIWLMAFTVILLFFGAFLILVLLRQRKARKTLARQNKTIEAQTQKLKEIDQLKSRFFANVSHELRTPLTLMLGPISSMLKSQQLDTKNFTYTKLVQQNAKDLLQLVSEILDLTKMESSKLELKEETTSIFQIMGRLVASFESMAVQKEIKYEYKFLAHKELYISLDSNKFEKVFNNFLSNAFKFTSRNSEIKVQLEDLGSHLQLQVKDTGRGIHPDDVPHVFERFYQSSQKDTPTEGGTGIGLALCAEYAKLMEGEIWVESELEKGSAFYFKFPKKQILGSEFLEEESIKEIDEITTASLLKDIPSLNEGASILLVEDNTNLRNYIQLILSDKYNVTAVENGAVAWELLSKQPSLSGTPLGNLRNETQNCQLIISDIMMPIMDGYQLLEKIKSSKQIQHIPVIMLTARADLQDKLKALRIGVDDYMLKPFEEEELLARVENLLNNSSERKVVIEESEDILSAPDIKSTVDSPALNPAPSNNEWLEEIEAAILQKIGNSNFSVETLADEFGLSRWQFNRKIKQSTGLTAINYVQEARLNQARQYLEQGKYTSIKLLSHAIGISDTKYFSRQFKKRFGKLPSSYFQ